MASENYVPRLENDREKQLEEEESVVNRRIERLSLHICPSVPLNHHMMEDLEMLRCGGRGRKKINVRVEELSNYMSGNYRDVQEKIFDYFNSRPELQTPIEISKDDHRELCMKQLVGLVREANIRPFRYVTDDPGKYFAIVEAVGSVDMSLGIKMGVQYR